MELTVLHVLNSGTHVSGLGLLRGVCAQLGQLQIGSSHLLLMKTFWLPFCYYIHIKLFENTDRGFLIIFTLEKERK